MRSRAATVALLAASLAATEARARGPDALVVRAESSVASLEAQLLQVEKLYARESESAERDVRQKRFSDAETQFLLGEYGNAAVLLYDLVEDRAFRESPQLGDAYYYLAESLYQQENFLGARRYFEALLRIGKSRYLKAALRRFLQITGSVKDFAAMEEFFRRAQESVGVDDRGELAYIHAKWTFLRTDLPDEQRRQRAEQLFSQLFGGAWESRARYFLGVSAIQRGDLKAAEEQFQAVRALVAKDEKQVSLLELSNLALGRLYYEQGRYDDALDRYQDVGRESDSFNDALYEIAWTYVKKGDFERALRSVDLLLLTTEDTVRSPDAKILQGQLLLRLRKFEEAKEAYNGLINTYAPVRDELDALLTAHADPIAHFNELLTQKGATLDLTQLLPPLAARWATTEKEVSEALGVVRGLEASRQGIAESRAIAARLLENLGRGTGLEASPTLAEGMAKADAADTAALTAQRELAEAERALLAGRLPADQQAELDRLAAERRAVEERVAALPKSPAALDQRRERRTRRLEELDALLHRVGNAVDSLDAQVRALLVYTDQTRQSRRSSAEAERAFVVELQQETERMRALRDEYQALRRQLLDERAAVGAGGGGSVEEGLRRQYDELLVRERELLLRARGSTGSQLFDRIDRVRLQLAEVQGRIRAAKEKIRSLADRRAREIREAVLAESKLLDQYEGEANGATTDARNLVGKIAYESFSRLRRSFYDLVLKADVGLVDVAWARKREKSAAIQKLAAEKDAELQALDAEFRDILKEEP